MGHNLTVQLDGSYSGSVAFVEDGVGGVTHPWYAYHGEFLGCYSSLEAAMARLAEIIVRRDF